MPEATTNPFALVGQCGSHYVQSRTDALTNSWSERRFGTCPDCGGVTIYEASGSTNHRGGGNGYSEMCTRCNYQDGDGDGWRYDEDGMSGYEAYCDAEYHRANPGAYLTDALCHNCTEVPAQDGTMLCEDCEVQIYGAEQAAAKAEQRRLKALPYRPVEVTQ